MISAAIFAYKKSDTVEFALAFVNLSGQILMQVWILSLPGHVNCNTNSLTADFRKSSLVYGGIFKYTHIRIACKKRKTGGRSCQITTMRMMI